MTKKDQQDIDRAYWYEKGFNDGQADTLDKLKELLGINDLEDRVTRLESNGD